MLRAVLFDLFETLITESGTRPAGVSSLAPILGCDPEAFRKRWKAARPAVILGQLSFRQALGEIATSLGSHADDATLDRVRDERVRAKGDSFTAVENQIVVMLDQLRSRGLRLAILSNCFVEDVAAWPACPWSSKFDASVFSFDVGMAKPDSRIYLEATQRLGVDVSEAWFVGDGGDGELTGAEQAGLRAFKALWFLKRWPHFHDEQHLSATLASVDDLVTLVDQSLGARRVQQFPGSSQEFV